jgi:hypothetical protein
MAVEARLGDEYSDGAHPMNLAGARTPRQQSTRKGTG